MIKTTPYDTSEYLDGDEMMSEYLKISLEDEDPEIFIMALGNVAKARGMAQIAREAGLSRENLIDSLRSGPKERQETIEKILKALNIKLSADAADAAE